MTRAQRVVHHAVAERCGADLAPLRLVDEEVGVGTGRYVAAQQVVAQLRAAGQQLGTRRPRPRGVRRLPRAARRNASSRLAQLQRSSKGGTMRGGFGWQRNWYCSHGCSICWPGCCPRRERFPRALPPHGDAAPDGRRAGLPGGGVRGAEPARRRAARKPCRMRTPRSIGCGSIFVLPTAGPGSTTVSTRTSAPRWQRSASCWAAGSSRHGLKGVGAAGASPGGARLHYAPDAMPPRADGTHLRHRSLPGLVRQTVVGRNFRRRRSACSGMITMWDEHNTRKPILSLRLSGLLLLRAAERALSALLFHEPPRTTRATSQGAPQNCTLPDEYGFVQAETQKNASAAARRDQ